MQEGARQRWLLFIHQLPAQPDYLRVKIGRRLARLGARPLKRSVYLLPWSEEAVEDFQWLRREVEAEGGSAVLWEAMLLEGLSDQELERRFADPLSGAAPSARSRPPAEIGRGNVWVTREGVGVDRIASAWLIRRRIDPEARFKFVPARGYRPGADELRFDMYEAEFTHEGDRCTFEVLLRRFHLDDAGLRVLGEIVHDIDCKDGKFGRPETPGMRRLIHGLVEQHPEDGARFEAGMVVLDALYQSYRR
jgi:hypothetical protein